MRAARVSIALAIFAVSPAGLLACSIELNRADFSCRAGGFCDRDEDAGRHGDAEEIFEDSGAREDGAIDSGADASNTSDAADASGAADARVPADASPRDTGPADAGDAGSARDTGTAGADGGSTDAGTIDTGVSDGGIVDVRTLRVELTWDGAGDLDLHLHDDDTAAPWFSDHDCYYANRTPVWNGSQPAGTGENPSLDVDNLMGMGPEITHIDTAAIGRSYTVAVDTYSNATGRIATIRIFCGTATSPVRTLVSNALNAGTSGSCGTGDFWKVAAVSFTGPNACTISTIDTVVTTSAACMTF